MKVEEWRIFIITSVLILVSLTILPFLQGQVPTVEEGFFSIGVLNDEGYAQNYFPSGPIINRDISWFIQVSNQMNNPELLSIRVKLLNSAMISPNSTTGAPSQGVMVYEEQILLDKGEETLIPFAWNFNNVTEGDVYTVNSIQVNNIETQHTLIDPEGVYKIVFEVWNYDIEENNYVFNWKINNQYACTWAQVIIKLH